MSRALLKAETSYTERERAAFQNPIFLLHASEIWTALRLKRNTPKDALVDKRPKNCVKRSADLLP